MNRAWIFFAISFLFLFGLAVAEPMRLISLQGRLTDASGNQITSPTNFVFRIYDVSAGGVALWTETQNSVTPDSNGIFSVLLGSVTAIGLPFDKPYWLSVQVGTETLSPRQRIGSAPYAVRSENPWNMTGNNVYTTNT